MGKILVIAEKPSAGADMAKVLGCTERKDGYIEGGQYIVTWAVGHLIGLKTPQEHDSKYAKWNLGDLPFYFDLSDSLKVLPDTAKQFKVIKELINRADVDSLINAGDAGREGYLIQSWIYRFAGNRKPTKVLWASSLTEEALRKAFADLKSDKEFVSLLQEAEARAEGDYLLGMNYSRILTLTCAGDGVSLAYGRCQTPLLNLIVMRDFEIEAFQSKPYYNLESTYAKGFKGILVNDSLERTDFLDKQEALNVQAVVSSRSGRVNSYKKETKSKKAPLLYNLAALQKTMGSRYGYTPEETLNLAQSLYEKHKILSYPRTDSQYLSMDLFHEIAAHLQSCLFGSFKPFIDKIDINNIIANKCYFNDHKVTDHHALLPTVNPNMEKIYLQLSEKEKNVFDAVVTNFIAIFYPAYEYDTAEIVVEISGNLFLSKGTAIRKLGYKEVLKIEPSESGEQETDGKQILPEFLEGEELTVDSIKILDKMTQPPKRYTVSSLIAVMEKYSIGTSATRADIINKLQNPKRTFITLEKGKYISTKLGREYIAIVPEALKHPGLTAEFEQQLGAIQSGTQNKQAFLKSLIDKIRADKQDISSSPAKPAKISRDVLCGCPKCKQGKLIPSMKALSCNQEGCTFILWKTVAGKTLSEGQIKQLIEKGKTGLIKGFKSKAGKSFDAALVIKDDFSVGMEFASK